MKKTPNPIQREGQFDVGYFPITSNALDIPRRLKELDARFFVMFHAPSQKYEVHVKGQLGSSLGCVLPYDTLDARALEYVQRFSCYRLHKTIAEVDAHNERIDRQAQSAYLDGAGQKMKEAVRYLDHHERAETIPKELIEA